MNNLHIIFISKNPKNKIKNIYSRIITYIIAISIGIFFLIKIWVIKYLFKTKSLLFIKFNHIRN